MDRSEHIAAHPYYLYGIEDERNRIIEKLATYCSKDFHDFIDGCNCDIIAFIKGEKE